MKVLNLYAGIGGNRKLWEDVEVAAVEINPEIAAIYQDFFPQDRVIVGDAHKYLLDHYNEFDFIWSSPPCQTHSDIRRMGVGRGLYSPVYPDIKLWEEVTLLKHFARCKWVVENVKPYYEPIIQPTFKLDRHYFWSNFYAPQANFKSREMAHNQITGHQTIYGFDISNYHLPSSKKRTILRNLVSPYVALHILNQARGSIAEKNHKQLDLFKS